MAKSIIERLEASNGEYDPQLCSDIHDLLPEPKCVQPPNYLASIDAAMTLLPEGCMWNVGGDPKGGFASAGLFGAAIWQGIDQIHGEAPTPAIALCIAALKATRRNDHARRT